MKPSDTDWCHSAGAAGGMGEEESMVLDFGEIRKDDVLVAGARALIWGKCLGQGLRFLTVL